MLRSETDFKKEFYIRYLTDAGTGARIPQLVGLAYQERRRKCMRTGASARKRRPEEHDFGLQHQAVRTADLQMRGFAASRLMRRSTPTIRIGITPIW